jgi:predicted nucleic acid-binding protein
MANLATLRAGWLEILPSHEVRGEAMRLLRVHPLRAADALQLAAALLWKGAAGEGRFVTFDERLGLAARLEGMRVVP